MEKRKRAELDEQLCYGNNSVRGLAACDREKVGEEKESRHQVSQRMSKHAGHLANGKGTDSPRVFGETITGHQFRFTAHMNPTRAIRRAGDPKIGIGIISYFGGCC